jgi:preprotein translocase subunit SecF
MAERKRGVFSRLYNGETAIDFLGRRQLWFMISAFVVAAGLTSLFTRSLNLGIDFEGGTSWEVDAPGVSVSEARDALRPVGLAGAKIQVVGGDTLRVQAEVADDPEQVQRITAILAELGDASTDEVNLNEVGPSWGDEISEKALRALIFFLVAITIYITLRFELKMALATLTALFHDILVTVGIYSLFGFEVTPATVIAILTILGYSIYDGIVVFDKIEENTRGLAATGRMTYGEMVNLSLNQVLMRTLNTSITALLPILSLLVVGSLILGATTLQEFALALLVGLGASAYSSIFIASPMLALLKEREPRYAAIKQRLAGRGGGVTGPPLTPAAAAAAAGSGAGVSGATGAPSDEAFEAVVRGDADDRPTPRASGRATGSPRPGGKPAGKRPPPRPRKKRRRR